MSDACKKHPRLFGSSVSISNKLVLVGAPAIGHRGKVYTYLIKSSTKKQSYDPISAFGGHDDDGFGISCKIYHKGSKCYYALIGAHRNYEQGVSIGAAYIFFTKNEGVTWTQHTKLLPPVSINNGYFGCSVDLIEGIAIVGSYGDNSNGLKSGSAHIYLNSGMSNPEGWFVAHSLYPDMYGESIKHCPEDKYNNTDYVNNYFGFSVNITENYAVVGAPSERKGSAYLFYSSTLWANYSEDKRILVKKLENTRLNRFGFSVTADGTKILIGAPGRDGVGGSSTLFSVDPYVLHPQMTLSIPDNISLSGKEFNTQCLSARSLFGRSTALLGNTILVSGHGRTCENNHVGSAFLYTSDTSLIDSSITIEPITCLRDKVSKELFGHDIDISAEYVVIGDPSKETAHVYDLITLKANQKLKRWLASDQKLLASDFFSYSINIHD